MTVYLCTCGTSAARNIRESDGRPRVNAAWVNAQASIESAAQQVHDHFAHAAMDDDDALRRVLSAEIHSLARMGVTAQDRVILYSSETPDGQACAEAVAAYLRTQRQGIDCRVVVIEGLQVRDAQRFRTAGVLNFTKQVLNEIANWGAEQCILNPTGGFKSLVPYTVLIGMIKAVPAKYIFEQSTALIPLPLMPVEFARERIEAIRPLLERIQRDSAIPRHDLERALPYAQRESLTSLFEDLGDGQITLSPVGFLLFEELDRPRARVAYLSRRALDDLRQIRAIEGTKPDDFIQRIANDTQQLDSSRHESLGADLFWHKPGGHTRDRYLVSVEGWRLLIWRITDHDEYDRILDANRRSPKGPGTVAERRDRYEPFVRMDLYETHAN